MARNDIFANLVNYYIFHGRQVLKPEDLTESDSVESILLSNYADSRRTVEKYRDILKRAVFKQTAQTGFLLIGIENHVADYSIHLVDPHRMSEADYCCLGNSLQYVMRFIAASGSNTDMKKLLHDFKNQYMYMERDAAELLKACTKTDLLIETDEEVVDMCKAWQERLEEGRQEGETYARRQIKAAIYEIKNGCDTIELLLAKGFSHDTAMDAIEIAEQFSTN